MSSSELTSLSPSPVPSAEECKPSLIVKLKLSKDHLSKFAPKSEDATSTPAATAATNGGSPSSEAAVASNSAQAGPPSSPAPAVATGTATPAPAAVASGVASSPAPSDGTGAATPSAPINGTAAAVNNRKRGKAGGSALRPGPKKRRIDGQSPVGSTNGGFGLSHPHPKLGPKSSAGAINAGLRALDRTGAPCKRWKKAEFKLKSFTGFEWRIGSFKTELNALSSQPSTPETQAVSTASADSASGTTPMEGLELTKPETTQPNGTSADSNSTETPTPSKLAEATVVDKNVQAVKETDEPNKNMNGIKDGMHSPLVASAV